MSLIPPAPIGSAPGSQFWNDWYERLRVLINSGTISSSWTTLDFTGSNITDIASRNHNQLQAFQGGTPGEYYHITATQHSELPTLLGGTDSTQHFHNTDRARANHTGTQTMSTISDLPVLASGTYTPTLTNTTNVDASTAYICQYLRVGAVVTVSGRVDIDALGTGATTLSMSLPIASNFTTAEQAAGTGTDVLDNDKGLWIEADPVNNLALLNTFSVGLDNHSVYFTYTYQVI